jgi:hypothetical protein
VTKQWSSTRKGIFCCITEYMLSSRSLMIHGIRELNFILNNGELFLCFRMCDF